MKPLQCIFGHHKYKPKDVIVYFKGNRGGRWYYRAVHKCCLCGAEKQIYFDCEQPYNKYRDKNLINIK